MVSDTLMNRHSLRQPEDTSIFLWRAAHPLRLTVNVCLCFSFFLSLSCTSSHLCSEPPAAEEIISDNRIRTICIKPLRERSCHCTAHSDSWGQGQMGALIGPAKAPNTPLWSELTAIGWLFISNRIAVDPLAEGLQLFFFFHRLHIGSNSRPLIGKVFKIRSKPQNTQTYHNWGNIPPMCLQGSLFCDRSKKRIHSRRFRGPGSPGTPNSELRKWGVNHRPLNWPNNRFLKSIFRYGWVYCTILGLIVSF